MKNKIAFEVAALIVIVALVAVSGIYYVGLQAPQPQFQETVQVETVQAEPDTRSLYAQCVESALDDAENCILADGADVIACRTQGEAALEGCKRFE